jgi:hypothetical protein
MTELPELPPLPRGWKYQMTEMGASWDRRFIFHAYKNNVRIFDEKVQLDMTVTPAKIKTLFNEALERLASRANYAEIPDKNEEVIVHYKWALQEQK